MNSIVRNQSLTWWNMTSVQIGGAICLPVLIVGEQLARLYGLYYSIAAIMIGNLLLCFMALIMGYMSFYNKKTTVENAYIFFGRFGTYLLACAMIIGLTGWFAIQLNLISLSVIQYITSVSGYAVSPILINMVLGLSIIYAARAGMSALVKIADITMPLLVGMILYGVYLAYQHGVPLPYAMSGSFKGISLVLATAVMAVLDIPTYYKHSRSLKDSLISIVVLFLIILPLLELAGVVICVYSPSGDLIQVFTHHASLLWQLMVTLFFVCAGWTTNNANIYSAAIAAQTLLPRVSYKTILYSIGLIATGLACLVEAISFEFLLNAMGIMVSSFGSALIAGYVWSYIVGVRRVQSFYIGNIFAALFGFFLGIASLLEVIQITNMPLIDALIAALIGVLIVQLFLELIQNRIFNDTQKADNRA